MGSKHKTIIKVKELHHANYWLEPKYTKFGPDDEGEFIPWVDSVIAEVKSGQSLNTPYELIDVCRARGIHIPKADEKEFVQVYWNNVTRTEGVFERLGWKIITPGPESYVPTAEIRRTLWRLNSQR